MRAAYFFFLKLNINKEERRERERKKRKEKKEEKEEENWEKYLKSKRDLKTPSTFLKMNEFNINNFLNKIQSNINKVKQIK